MWLPYSAETPTLCLDATSSTPPVKFVACWTPGGEVVGGTGHALRVAKAHGVPIRNLGDPSVMERARAWVERLEADR